MTKAQLVKTVSKSTGIDGKTVEYVIDVTTETIKDAVVAGESVTLRQFGAFSRQYRQAKVGRDMNHNCTVEIPAHYVPRFKPSREYIEAVNV